MAPNDPPRFIRAMLLAAKARADEARHWLRSAPSRLSGSYIPQHNEYVTRLSSAAKVTSLNDYQSLKARQEKARAALTARGIHDPAFMPFAFPWTDVPSPQLERNTMQFYWRTRAEMSPADWNLNFAVMVDGRVVGSTGMITHDFPNTRRFETGSWLGSEFQGRGIGKEMRVATDRKSTRLNSSHT